MFVCLTTRAVHIETADTLDTDSPQLNQETDKETVSVDNEQCKRLYSV